MTVARSLEEGGHDAVHVGDLGLLGAVDTKVMLAAAESDRVLVSADIDFGELLAIGQQPALCRARWDRNRGLAIKKHTSSHLQPTGPTPRGVQAEREVVPDLLALNGTGCLELR